MASHCTFFVTDVVLNSLCKLTPVTLVTTLSHKSLVAESECGVHPPTAHCTPLKTAPGEVREAAIGEPEQEVVTDVGLGRRWPRRGGGAFQQCRAHVEPRDAALCSRHSDRGGIEDMQAWE